MKVDVGVAAAVVVVTAKPVEDATVEAAVDEVWTLSAV